MANTRSFLTGPIPTPQRLLGLGVDVRQGNNPTVGIKPVKPLLGFTNQGYLQVGTKTSASGFLLNAGDAVPSEKSRFMTLTITTGAGALAVTSNGFDISVVQAAGGSTAAAVVAAINAQFSSKFAFATLNQGSAGGSNVANLAKTNLKADNRFSAFP
jgi:hypothetical protein